MSRFATTFPRRVTEWASATTVASLGILISAGTMHGFLTPLAAGELYLGGLARVAPLAIWGPLLILLGLWRLSALAINGAWRPTPHMRALTAALSGLVYLQLIIGVVAAAGPILALAMLPPLLGAEIYVSMRASEEAREADEVAARRRGGRRNGASA